MSNVKVLSPESSSEQREHQLQRGFAEEPSISEPPDSVVVQADALQVEETHKVDHTRFYVVASILVLFGTYILLRGDEIIRESSGGRRQTSISITQSGLSRHIDKTALPLEEISIFTNAKSCLWRCVLVAFTIVLCFTALWLAVVISKSEGQLDHTLPDGDLECGIGQGSVEPPETSSKSKTPWRKMLFYLGVYVFGGILYALHQRYYHDLKEEDTLAILFYSLITIRHVFSLFYGVLLSISLLSEQIYRYIPLLGGSLVCIDWFIQKTSYSIIYLATLLSVVLCDWPLGLSDMLLPEHLLKALRDY